MSFHNYIDLKGRININTLSPSRNFFYKVQKPIEINMGNFACKIAFYNKDNELIYHNINSYAHWLSSYEDIMFVLWSKEGNLVYFYEYQQNQIYDSVFINLRDKYCFRINELTDNFKIVNSFNLEDRKYDECYIINELLRLGFLKKQLVTNEILKTALFKRRKWFPEE